MTRLIALIVTGCLLSLTLYAQAAQPGEPVDQLKPFIEKVIAILEEPAENDHPEAKVDRIMEVAREGFDFKEMSRRVLGRQWRLLSEPEKEEFVGLFAELLKYAYIDQLDNYSSQEVRYARQRIKGNRAQIDTLLVDGSLEIPISYVMLRKGEQWLIYDIGIEGVSLLRNYREQFQTILRKNEFQVLTRQIQKRISELHQADDTG